MKRFFVLLTALSVLLASIGSVYAAEEPSDWAADEVARAKELLLLGPIDPVFEPVIDLSDYTVPISRREFCELVNNLILSDGRSIVLDAGEEGPAHLPFTDTDNYSVRTLYEAGIINGKSETQFAPNDSLTREEAATILMRAINKYLPVAEEKWAHAGQDFEFADRDQVSDWAAESVKSICRIGIMEGIENNRFAPKQVYTKEQAIAAMVRAYDATTRIYTYETPLGTYTTHKNSDTFVNFGISCNARISLHNRDEDKTFTGERKVKAITNQTSRAVISFDDFAAIFGGSWSMKDNRFFFDYNPETQPDLGGEYTTQEPERGAPWPNQNGRINCVDLSDIDTVFINGAEVPLHGQYGGRIIGGTLTMYDGELYIPVQMVAELTDGYDLAYLDIVWDDLIVFDGNAE